MTLGYEAFMAQFFVRGLHESDDVTVRIGDANRRVRVFEGQPRAPATSATANLALPGYEGNEPRWTFGFSREDNGACGAMRRQKICMPKYRC